MILTGQHPDPKDKRGMNKKRRERGPKQARLQLVSRGLTRGCAIEGIPWLVGLITPGVIWLCRYLIPIFFWRKFCVDGVWSWPQYIGNGRYLGLFRDLVDIQVGG
jgi:hypothetical protein